MKYGMSKTQVRRIIRMGCFKACGTRLLYLEQQVKEHKDKLEEAATEGEDLYRNVPYCQDKWNRSGFVDVWEIGPAELIRVFESSQVMARLWSHDLGNGHEGHDWRSDACGSDVVACARMWVFPDHFACYTEIDNTMDGVRLAEPCSKSTTDGLRAFCWVGKSVRPFCTPPGTWSCPEDDNTLTLKEGEVDDQSPSQTPPGYAKVQGHVAASHFLAVKCRERRSHNTS